MKRMYSRASHLQAAPTALISLRLPGISAPRKNQSFSCKNVITQEDHETMLNIIQRSLSSIQHGVGGVLALLQDFLLSAAKTR